MTNDLTQATEAPVAAKKAAPAVLRMIENQAPQFALALPKFIDPDHFKRVVLTEVRRTPKLLECDPMTVVASCMLAAQLGMEPGPLGQCYLLPRWNKKTGKTECNFQLGYKGALALAHRSGEIADVICEAVHANDEFARELGDTPRIVHNPAPWGEDRGEVIGYYAIVRTQNGGTYRDAKSYDEVQAHAKKYSEAFKKGDPKFGPWAQNFDAMARKTVLLQALKLAPMSVDIAKGIAEDDATTHALLDDLGAAVEADAEIVPDHGQS